MKGSGPLWLTMAPFLIVFVAFSLFPVLFSAWLGVHA